MYSEALLRPFFFLEALVTVYERAVLLLITVIDGLLGEATQL